MSNERADQLVHEIDASLDKIARGGSDQAQIHQAVTETKSKVQQLAQLVQQPQGQAQGQR
jgi:hypothetical protein